ncbi:hypothetical protein FQN60_015254 [Etheostoma spectabile]|uniref:Uncharacterized protein n=1 Tax=Etheostoma spectabile TaxID=54343 RepID=A0A5J5CTQ6_9PERO|nr:hypothetical protein FQN60_015254 [Etheostoma spectabile]
MVVAVAVTLVSTPLHPATLYSALLRPATSCHALLCPVVPCYTLLHPGVRADCSQLAQSHLPQGTDNTHPFLDKTQESLGKDVTKAVQKAWKSGNRLGVCGENIAFLVQHNTKLWFLALWQKAASWHNTCNFTTASVQLHSDAMLTSFR